MHLSLLEILQCPYCGSSLELVDAPSVRRNDAHIIYGWLRCFCTNYPVIDGIPVFLAGYDSLAHLLPENPEQALLTMLGLDEKGEASFRKLLARGDSGTFREFIELFSPGNEGPYFVHRFANPTHLAGQTVLRAVSGDRRCFARRAIDLCGGTGHLARTLCHISGDAEVVLTERTFWKLWLAKHITAPQCIPVCCDAEAPLPFRQNSFSLALCSDAFHYLWSKRMFATEMMRLVGEDGVIVLSHLHNALQENYSPGLPLAPQWWRNLFAEMCPRVFKESEILDSIISQQAINLASGYTDEQLIEEQALLLIATRLDEVFRVYENPDAQLNTGVWRINPLYEVTAVADGGRLKLRFPDEAYQAEYKVCQRYLPAQIELSNAALRSLESGTLNAELRALAQHHVILNLPERYL